MEFLNFKRIFWNWNEKYVLSETASDKICRSFLKEQLCVLTSFRISHIIVKKLNFRFLIFFFLNYKEKYASYEKMFQFKFVGLYVENKIVSTFFRISYNLTGKWNFDIDFFRIWICCKIFNFDLIKKCYQDNLWIFISTIKNHYWNFWFFQKVIFKNTKVVLNPSILIRCGWLTNWSLLFRIW